MLLKREIITIENDLFEIVKILKESDKPIVDTWKEYLGADKIFKKDGKYWKKNNDFIVHQFG